MFVQFLSTLEANIKRVSGPVKVSIPKGGITDGSVLVQTSVVFLNGEDECAKAHKSALTGSSASSVYGSYSAVVDPHTFHTDSTANPEQGKQNMLSMQRRRTILVFKLAPCRTVGSHEDMVCGLQAHLQMYTKSWEHLLHYQWLWRLSSAHDAQVAIGSQTMQMEFHCLHHTVVYKP